MIPIAQPTLNPLVPPPPPTMQTVDQQGQSQAPQGNDAGMATLQNPTAPVSGYAQMQDMLAAKGQSLPTVSSPSLNKLNDGMNQAAQAKATSGTPPKPGDWARSLVAGAQSMLAPAAGAVKGITASLGDAAAVGTVPRGGGALTGITRTLGARNDRQRQERQDQQAATKDQMLMAEANARMIHEQKLTHQLDDTAIQSSVDSGMRTVAKLKTANSPVPVLAQDMNAAQLTKFLQDNKIDPSKETAYPTGRRQTGENPDGTPKYETTYTAMGVPPDIDLNPADKKDKDLLDDMDRFAPPSAGKWSNGTGVTHMTGTQFNMVMQQVEEGRAATAARDKTLSDQKLAKEATDFKNAPPEWVNALAQAPNHDPIAARNAILADPKLSAKFPNLDNDLKEKYGEKNYDKMLDDWQKKIETQVSEAGALDKQLTGATGEKAADIGAAAQSALADPNTPPATRLQLQKVIQRADARVKASEDYKAKLEQDKQKAEAAQDEKDWPTLQGMVRHYDVEPDQLFPKGKASTQEKQKFFASLGNDFTGKPWSESTYKARYKTKQELADPKSGWGAPLNSLQTFTGHVADANDLIKTIGNTNSSWANKPINELKVQWGNDKVGAYRQALEAASKEYEAFLNNQHAENVIDKEAQAKLLNENTSPAAAQAILRQFTNTIAIKARAYNNSYRRVMGESIPDMFDAGQRQTFRDFAIDPDWITNPTNPGGATPGQAAAAQQQPAKKNPFGQ